MSRAKSVSRQPLRFRWVAPDGRRGRWRKSRLGAVMAAVGASWSTPGVKVSFDAYAAADRWPALKDKGWKLERNQ